MVKKRLCYELHGTQGQIWQNWTKVSFCGNQVPTKGMSKKKSQTGLFKSTRLPDLNNRILSANQVAIWLPDLKYGNWMFLVTEGTVTRCLL